MRIQMSLFNRTTLPEESLLRISFDLAVNYIEIIMGICMSLFNRRNATTLLPEDLVFSEILPKLPAKSLIRFKSVSKEWRDFITDDAALRKAHARHHRNSDKTSFVALQTKNDKTDQKLVFISGDDRRAREFETPSGLKNLIFEGITSCKGLVLVSKPLALWNPATGEFRALPSPHSDYGYNNPEYCPRFGLGFDEESEDHKVVRVTCDHNPEARSISFQVFSKRAGSWSKLQHFPGVTLCRPIHLGERVSSDKALYFLAEQGPNSKLAVMSFTYRNEEVRKLTDGPDFGEFPWRSTRLFHLRLMRWKEDSLAFITRESASEKPNVCDFWVMTKNSGDEGFCWSKLFVLDCYVDIRGVWSDRILINRKGFTELALWDPRTDGKKDNCLVLAEVDEPLICHFSAVIHYDPTLLSVY